VNEAGAKYKVVPDTQAEALEERHASSGQMVLSDGDDRGFIEAGSMKVALEMERSCYEKVLGIGRYYCRSGLERDLAGSAGLLFVVLRDMSMYNQTGTGTSRILGHGWAISWVSRRELSISNGSH